jgi:hypothetical protein
LFELPAPAAPDRARIALGRQIEPQGTTIWKTGLPSAGDWLPTITLEGDANGAPHPERSAYARMFSDKSSIASNQGGIGHNLLRKAPLALAESSTSPKVD